jgi:hypothetical protein
MLDNTTNKLLSLQIAVQYLDNTVTLLPSHYLSVQYVRKYSDSTALNSISRAVYWIKQLKYCLHIN